MGDFFSKRRQQRCLCWFVGWNVTQLDATGHWTADIHVGRPLLVRRSVKNYQCQYVDVPHTISTCEKSRRVFQLQMLIPLPAAFGHLIDNETNYSHGSARQCSQHQEPESVDDTLVVEAPHSRHSRQHRTLRTDVTEYFPNHVAQEDEVDTGWDTSADNECQRHIRTHGGHPYRVEGVWS